MNFKDSVSELKGNQNFVKRFFLKRKLKKLNNEYIRDCLQEIEMFDRWILDNKDQIHLWESESSKNKDLITQFTALNQFIEANMQLLFLECDLRLASTHMTVTDNDWEYRFFARRTYTLLHEARESYSNPAGKSLRLLEDLFSQEVLQQYKRDKKKLDEFLKNHDKNFKDIRNKVEAHKSSNINVQKETLQNFSVIDSWSIIQEVLLLIDNLSKDIISIYKAFMEKDLELMKKYLNNP